MPELRIKEVRLPELHLPEMSRDDITRTIGDAARDIDLSRLDPRRLDVPDLSDISRELSKIDLPKAVQNATGSRRSRLPFVIGGLLTLGLVAFAVATSPVLRPRLEAAAKRARERVEELRAERMGPAEEPHAFDAAVAVPIEPTAFSADAPTDGSPFDGSADLPDGFGGAVADLSPAAVEEDPARA